MKKNIPILFCLLQTFLFKGQTSVYHPFPDSNAVWNIHMQAYCFSNGSADEYYSITITGDTLINSQTYHKLFTPYVLSFSTGTCTGWPAGYKGAVRQDVPNKKVYFVPPSNSSEQLLYDFNMQVSDTVRGYIETLFPTPNIVQSMDSVLVGGTYRKRWNLDCYYNISFIEGLGSTYGLIERSPNCVTDYPVYPVTCFSQNGITLYPSGATSCQLITGVQNHPSPVISIYPNPASDKIYVKGKDVNEVKLFDLLGKEILSSKEKQTDISRLAEGIYFVQAKTSEGVLTQKIIIQR